MDPGGRQQAAGSGAVHAAAPGLRGVRAAAQQARQPDGAVPVEGAGAARAGRGRGEVGGGRVQRALREPQRPRWTLRWCHGGATAKTGATASTGRTQGGQSMKHRALLKATFETWI